MEKCKTLIDFEAPFQAVESTATNPVSRQTVTREDPRAARSEMRLFARRPLGAAQLAE